MAEEKQELGLSVSLGDRLLLAIKYDSVQQAEEIIEQMITQIAGSREIEEAEHDTMRHNILLNTIDNETGETLLHKAADGENIENIKWLVQEHGLNVMARDYYNNTPAHIAARAGNLDAVFWLADYEPDVKIAKNSDGDTVEDMLKEYYPDDLLVEFKKHFSSPKDDKYSPERVKNDAIPIPPSKKTRIDVKDVKIGNPTEPSKGQQQLFQSNP